MRSGFENIVNELPISSGDKQQILDDICTEPTRKDLIVNELLRMKGVFKVELAKSQSNIDKKTIEGLINDLENAHVQIMIVYEYIDCDACDERIFWYKETLEHVDLDPYLDAEFNISLLNCSDCAVAARREWSLIKHDFLY